MGFRCVRNWPAGKQRWDLARRAVLAGQVASFTHRRGAVSCDAGEPVSGSEQLEQEKVSVVPG